LKPLTVGIGLIGCGTVGGGVVELLRDQAAEYTRRLGCRLELRKVLVRDTRKSRGLKLPRGLLTADPEAFFSDESIGVVVETAGGVKPVGDLVRRALESGRHVVTANKALLATRGNELFALARRRNVCIAFEASCGGGIPILGALKFGLGANRVDAIYGILNGTCNHILTQMSENGSPYAAALAEAQKLGYAEADPTLDVNGADAAAKLAIVASLAFGVNVKLADVRHRGIDQLHIDDIQFGKELGYTAKLLAIGQRLDDGLALGVEPCFVHHHEPLAQVRLSFNALSVFGHAVGHVMFLGRGAGRMPTASAVVSDILNVVGGWYPTAFETLRLWPDQQRPARLAHPDRVTGRYYLRVSAHDKPGVMAKLTRILGDHGISISAVLQHETAGDGGVPVVVTTHQARQGAVRAAAAKMARLPVVRGKPVCMRIIDLPSG
jgi:homoserine dehydrogenase